MEVYFQCDGRYVIPKYCRGGVQGRGGVRRFFLVREISIEAVPKFAEHFGKLQGALRRRRCGQGTTKEQVTGSAWKFTSCVLDVV